MIDLTPLFGSADAAGAEDHTFRVFPKIGAERWMLETTQRRPWHLRTWPQANLRARLIYRAAWVLGAMGLHLPSRLETHTVAPGSVYQQLLKEFDQLGIFLGTPGPNRKFVVYAARSGRSAFVKIPLGPASAVLVAQETTALEELAQNPELAPLVPSVFQVAGHLAVEDIQTDGVSYTALHLSEVVRIHDLLEQRSATTRSLSALRRDWQISPEDTPAAQNGRTVAAIDKVRAAANNFLDGLPQDLEIPCYMAHGDFTRWNVLRASDGSARIIDWEMFGLKPRWFDLIHYFVSDDLLVRKVPAPKVVRHLEEIAQNIGAYSPDDDWWRQVGLYFACQSLIYCNVYERQVGLHAQALWQMDAWADILILIRNYPNSGGGQG